MSNKKPTYAVPEVKFTILQEASSTLTDAFEVALAAENVQQKVTGAFTGVFDTMRHNAVSIYRTFLAEANGDPEEINVPTMVGTFLNECQVAESSHKGESSKTWNNYKSKFKSAMENGINLNDNASIGYSKLVAALKQINDMAEAEREAAQQAAADKREGKQQEDGNAPQGGSQGVSGAIPPGESGSTGSKGNENPNDNGAPAHVDTLLSGLSSETQDILFELITMAGDMEGTDQAVKLNNILTMAKTQLTSAHKRAVAQLKAVS